MQDQGDQQFFEAVELFTKYVTNITIDGESYPLIKFQLFSEFQNALDEKEPIGKPYGN